MTDEPTAREIVDACEHVAPPAEERHRWGACAECIAAALRAVPPPRPRPEPCPCEHGVPWPECPQEHPMVSGAPAEPGGAATALVRLLDAVAAVGESSGHPLCNRCENGQQIDRDTEQADNELMSAWNAYVAARAAGSPEPPRGEPKT